MVASEELVVASEELVVASEELVVASEELVVASIVGFVALGSIVGLGSILSPVGQPYVAFVSATANCI